MSIRSMTGYGEHQVQDADWVLGVRLKTLNHRYLDVRVSGLDAYPALELRARERLTEAFCRGRVDLEVSLRPADQTTPLRFDLERARRYLEALRHLVQALGLPATPSLELLLKMEGVVRCEEADPEELAPLLAEALERAIAQVNALRAQEGTRLEAELKGFLSALRRLASEIAARAPQLKEHARARLEERLAALTQDLTFDEARLEEEVLLLVERGDITEELARLDSHCQAAERALAAPEPAGKVLDFLAQEIGREINTIAAKAKDAQISQDVVAMKAILEKFREQVRNIE